MFGVGVKVEKSDGGAWYNIFMFTHTNKGLAPMLWVVIAAIVLGGGYFAYGRYNQPLESGDVREPSIIVISPNVGETLELGKPYTFKWKTKGDVGLVDIAIRDVNEGRQSALQALSVATGVPNTGSYTAIIPSDISFFSSDARFDSPNYKVRLYGVCNSCSNTESIQRVMDESDAVFVLKRDSFAAPDWKTYHNEVHGFEFRYPTDIFTLLPTTQLLPPAPYHDGYDGVKLISSSNVNKLGKQECSYGASGIRGICSVEKERGINFVAADKAVRDLTASLTSPLTTLVTIAGKPSIQWSIGAEGEGIDYYFIPVDSSRTLVISRHYVDEGLPSGFPSKELFDQILSTFRFTK